MVPQTGADLEHAVRCGLFSVDANVLLNFYRYSPSARDALVSLLDALGDRVWVSHQAGREFWRNRMSALDERSAATNQLLEQLGKSGSTIDAAIVAWAKRTAAAAETVAGLRRGIEDAISGARVGVENETAEEVAFAYDPSNDPNVTALGRILEGRVGEALDQAEHAKALAEGERRCQEGIPPGFRDAEKSEGTSADGGAGDYLVWYQSLKEAKARALPLVILTGDEKDDWWWRHRGAFLGPREELSQECAEIAGVSLYMLRPAQLLQYAKVLNVEVSDATVGEVDRATAKDSQKWTKRGVDELLRRLDAEGVPHGDVIRAAAKAGGVIQRLALFEVAGYPEDRMLRGFTRPPNRITRDLQSAGIVEEGVSDVLTPEYEGVTAERFRIPDEVTSIVSAGAEDE